ncbi:MAG: hypothetical protein FJY95_04260 [Candidatus Handelsmanbacteria bacterium]|nr:hypothetical protein [Candidatus Handelsmanbacteria bacterium]
MSRTRQRPVPWRLRAWRTQVLLSGAARWATLTCASKRAKQTSISETGS